MSIRVAFEGGPADGTVEEYLSLNSALPRLYWSRDEPQHVSAVYRRVAEAPDSTTGRWLYSVDD